MFRQQSGAFSARGCLLSSQCVGCHAGRHITGENKGTAWSKTCSEIVARVVGPVVKPCTK